MNGEDDIGSATDQPRSRHGGWPVVDDDDWSEPRSRSRSRSDEFSIDVGPIEVGPTDPYVQPPYPQAGHPQAGHVQGGHPSDPRDEYPPSSYPRDGYQPAPRPGPFRLSSVNPAAAPPQLPQQPPTPPPPPPPPPPLSPPPSLNGRRFDPLTDEWPIIAADRSREQQPPLPPSSLVAPPTTRYQPGAPPPPPPPPPSAPPPPRNGQPPQPRQPQPATQRSLDDTDPLRLPGFQAAASHQASPPPSSPPPPSPPPPPRPQSPRPQSPRPQQSWPQSQPSTPRRRPSWIDDPAAPPPPPPAALPPPPPREQSYPDPPDHRQAPSQSRDYDPNSSRGRQLATGALLAEPPEIASGGWRKLVFRASGGAVNPGPSPEEVRHRRLITRIRTPLHDCHRIAVMSLKGGVGKTTTTVALGSTLASHRGDRVVAIDANPDRGTLSAKVPRTSPHTVRELLEDAPRLHRYVDVRQYLSQADSRLEVLASANDPEISEAFQESDYRAVDDLLQVHYSILLTDCGTGILHDAMHGVLSLADTLVIVSSSSADGGASASATLDWLEAHGYYDQVRQAVSVISMFPLNAQAVDVEALEQHFAARTRRVVRVPYDPHLAAGGEIVLAELRRETRQAYQEIAGAVAERFDS